MHLTPDTTDDEIRALTTPSRASEERRSELQRLASLCTDRALEITVEFDEQRAFCRPADERGIDFAIRIPTTKYEQVTTSLPPTLWDRRVQIALLFHELGHVHYSDFDRFGERRSDVNNRWRELFRTVYNAAEDGVVETQMANEFTVTDDFVLLNEALVNHADEKHRRFVELFEDERIEGRPIQTYTVFEALTIGLLDRGFVDSGRFRELLDESHPWRCVKDGREGILQDLEPLMDTYMAAMLSEPDGAERVELAVEFFESVRPYFESLPPMQRQRHQTTAVRPPDVRAAEGWTARPADQLPSEGAAERSVRRRSTRFNSAEGESPESGSGGLEPPGRVGDERFRRAAGRASRGRMNGHSGRGDSPLAREAVRVVDVIRDDAVDLEEVVVVESATDGGDTDRWRDAVARSKALEADLRSQLRRERRPRERPGRRAGRVDTRRLVEATQGTQRVFTRKEAGTQKDYSCLLVLDRSGSMDGQPIRKAEFATAQLAQALFAVGVDVSVLSAWRTQPCLELPFGANPEEYVGRLMTARASGSTPLSDTLVLARNLLSHGRGSIPFLIVITDGDPDDRGAYQEQLSRCSVPVFGVYIGTNQDADYFDRIVYADTDSLDRTIDRLIRRLFTQRA